MQDQTAVVAVGSRARASTIASRWESGYRRAVLLADLAIIVVALRIGLVLTDGSLAGHVPGAIAGITALVLLACMAVSRVWEQRVLGQGAEEFRRLGNALLAAAFVLGLTALAMDVGYFRPWVFGVLPATGLCLATTRYAMRRVLHAQRRQGRYMHPVLVAGSLDEVADLVDRTHRERHNGWSVTGVCIPGGTSEGRPMAVRDVPVVGGLPDVPALVGGGDYRIVAVAPAAHWNRQQLRELAWALEGSPAELVVAPALMEVTGPRLHVDPVYGLTLLRVSQPSFTGIRWVLKSVVDRFAALLVLVVVTPVLLAVVLAIKLNDGGPVLFRQHRVGKAGQKFPMLKFRTMVVDAEWRRRELEHVNEGAGLLFKVRADPRVTRVGGMLRRYSLDELPQLINVLAGHMSMVGPRPPLPTEVEQYGYDARRRLLVKPGLTGLWQVSGRSDLSWEETVRLDLRYVENWSFAMDAVILWKTLGAVLRGHGAY
ncbi:MAG: exopolysaccharide biosynthesis polyprenyl glycosylphosphotransferase [Pseudonocardiaceae bacterium]|nr:exopolysaccharide biosynthesis polyprenyl glycosylphosphotransferase [Pseudonocardiaceae bacterium]